MSLPEHTQETQGRVTLIQIGSSLCPSVFSQSIIAEGGSGE